MIKLFSVKEKQQKEQAAAAAGKPKQTPGELRIAKDISELNLAKTTSIKFPDGNAKLMKFEVTIKPDEGYYRGGAFTFTFDVPGTYPHEAPKVKCLTKCYHPNIDLEGNVCLNILREDWKPVLSINSIIYGLQFLFMDPNPDDPLNKEAAEVLQNNPNQFAANVKRTLNGGHLDGVFYPSALA